MVSDDFAVRVNGVSKIYRLWNSPRDRLVTTVRGLLTTLLPSKSEWNEKQESPNYRDFYALNNISLDIRKGESWGFVGVNGSGKSTLLKIISGNLRPSTGHVEIDGKVAILDYGSGFNGEFTGKENIYIKATLLGLTRKKIHERYQSIVEFAELGEFINQPVKTYSSGMISRLGFAIMAHVDADIIITDEALAVGDVFFIQKCMNFIRAFLKKGTFLFVSHSINDVLSLCQNAVWLEQGTIKAVGPALKVAKAYLDKDHTSHTKNVSSNENESLQAGSNENEKPVIVLGQPALSQSQTQHLKDARSANPTRLISDSTLKIPVFDAIASQDKGGATILSVTLTNEKEEPFSQMIGGETVKLTVQVKAESRLNSPVVSFQVLDRLGQILFSDNSYLITRNQPFEVDQGDTFSVKFIFQLPLLPPGNYVFRILAALVNQEGEAEILHTVPNALAIHSVTSGARHGLVGIPMHSIKLKCQSVANGE